MSTIHWPDRLELALEMCQQAEDARRATLAGFGTWAVRVGELSGG